MSAASVSRQALPFSQLSAMAIASRFSSIRSAILLRTTARSDTEVLPHAGAAACAASEGLFDVVRGAAGHLREVLAGYRGGVLEVLPLGRRDVLTADEVVIAGACRRRRCRRHPEPR